MTGFEFIAKAFKASYTDIAKRLNLTTSTVADWASGRRPIPKDKLLLLSQLFKIDEEYFRKKALSEVEELKIEINYLERASKRDTHWIEQTIVDDDGIEQEVYSWHDPHEGDLSFKYEELAYVELALRLRGILNRDFHLEMQCGLRIDHFAVVKELADLLDQDKGEEGLEEYRDVLEDELLRRKKVAIRVDALRSMLNFLNRGKFSAFGKVDPFELELYELLYKYGVVENEPPKHIEIDEPFDQVHPRHKS